ncbi:MAG: histone deacetylase family protein [Paracoccaceae bacterium]
MTTAFFWHDDCLSHVNPQGHPERVARLEAIRRALAAPQFAGLDWRELPLAARDDLLLCHPDAYVAAIEAASPKTGMAQVDGDTFLSPGSLTAAMRAVGGCVAAVDAVLDGAVANAFVAARPPGHHAETDTAMGFCLFGNVSIAAKHALERRGLSRVAIVDFDVHHGNGTQDLVWNDGRILFVSSHQHPLYPGTGAPGETGAHGNVLNVQLSAGGGSAAVRAAYRGRVWPRLRAFKPELVLVSAGFDAHERDPLGALGWTTDDFRWLTQGLCDVAADCCGGRVVSTLEGGYDLEGLAAGVAAHVAVLMERGA